MKTIHNFNEVFDGQKVFRKILDAMSRPGEVVDLQEEAGKMWGENKTLLAIAMTLVDNQVSFNTQEERTLAEEIATLTLSHEVPVEEADFIFVTCKEELSKVIEQVKEGDLTNPHKGATLIITAEDIWDHPITISGPGIDGVKQMSVPADNTVRTLTIRDAMQHEYPEGIDLIFVTKTSKVFCLPRLVRWGV